MTGGTLQLNGFGKQDVYLTGKPSINHFRYVYRQYVNFAIEQIRQTPVGEVNFGRKFSVYISRSADLLSNVSFVFKLPALSIAAGSTYTGWTNNLASTIVKQVELEIGNQVINRLYSVWLDIWDELTTDESHRDANNLRLGKFDDITATQTNATADNYYSITIPFYFNKHPELALPLLALKYSDVKVNIELREFQECVTYDGATAPTAVNMTYGIVYGEYVYLDPRILPEYLNAPGFIYLIRQVNLNNNAPQVIAATGTSVRNIKQQLAFNNPVSELVWVLVESLSLTNNDWFNYSKRSDTTNQITEAGILADGQDLVSFRTEDYFRLTLPIQYHTHGQSKHIYINSFALHPEDLNPSGSINFSRYDSVELQLRIKESNLETNLYVFAINYNLLVVKNGMAGLSWNA